ncbi:synaptonemal complex protein 3-like, partial [Meles meles]|uniref:synaptonemal complex protein 3-like n=1 Tax=Meles meles TaxID=9662 RepID=UPI001E6A0E52
QAPLLFHFFAESSSQVFSAVSDFFWGVRCRHAGIIREQKKILQQARVVLNQRLQKIKNLNEQFLKSMQDLEKEHEPLLADEQREVREEMTKLQNKIMMEAQRQELAIVRKYLHSLFL